MRSVLLAVIVCISSILVPGKATAASTIGLTVAPAMALLSLAPGQTETQTNIHIYNGYSAATAVAFSVRLVAQSPGKSALTNQRLSNIVRIEQPVATIAPQQTFTQAVTLYDDATLPPGSTSALLVIEEQTPGGHGVSLHASMQIPTTIVKQAGAVSKVSLDKVVVPAAAALMPTTIQGRFQNQGNMVAIPRGTVSVVDPRGHEVASGVINSESLAVSPAEDVTLQTRLHSTGLAWLPGRYRLLVTYRTSDSQQLRTYQTTLWYIAWWHILSLVALGAAVYYARQLDWRRFVRLLKRPKPRPPQPPARRQRLLGRDIT